LTKKLEMSLLLVASFAAAPARTRAHARRCAAARSREVQRILLRALRVEGARALLGLPETRARSVRAARRSTRGAQVSSVARGAAALF